LPYDTFIRQVFGYLETSYVNQKADKFFSLSDDEDQFVLVDAEVGYRLPKRYGIVRFVVRNLFDEEFRFRGIRTSQEDVPPFVPGRNLFAHVTFAF
jgi:outer membrane receptor protein involved in Fe transport